MPGETSRGNRGRQWLCRSRDKRVRDDHVFGEWREKCSLSDGSSQFGDQWSRKEKINVPSNAITESENFINRMKHETTGHD